MVEWWENFYNQVFRAPSMMLKGGIILGIFLLAVLCLVGSIRGKSKVGVNNWFLFFLFILLTVLGVAYGILTA